jgi:hypothetical protein
LEDLIINARKSDMDNLIVQWGSVKYNGISFHTAAIVIWHAAIALFLQTLSISQAFCDSLC